MNTFLAVIGAVIFLAVGLLSVLQDLIDRSPHDSPLLGERACGAVEGPSRCTVAAELVNGLPAVPATLLGP